MLLYYAPSRFPAMNAGKGPANGETALLRKRAAEDAPVSPRTSQSRPRVAARLHPLRQPRIKWADEPGDSFQVPDVLLKDASPTQSSGSGKMRQPRVSFGLLSACAAMAVIGTAGALLAAHSLSDQAPSFATGPQSVLVAATTAGSSAPAAPVTVQAEAPAIAARFAVAQSGNEPALEQAVQDRLRQALARTQQPVRAAVATAEAPAAVELAFSEPSPQADQDGLAAIVAATEPAPAAMADIDTPGSASQSPASAAVAPANPPVPDTAPETNVATAEPAPQAPAPASESGAEPAIITSSVNMRASAANDAQVLAVVPANVEVGLSSCDDWWCAIRYDGKIGYVSKRFVSHQS